MIQAPRTATAAEIFDRQTLRKKRMFAAAQAGDHNFLIDWAAEQLVDRLADIKRDFPRILQNGARPSPKFVQKLFQAAGGETIFTMDSVAPSPGKVHSPTFFRAEEDLLPVRPGSLDLIFSVFSLHSVNDLPGALIQMRRALKPDGLFLAALPGGETLRELRTVMTETEIALKGGLSPRMHPFASKQDMGALLQRAGFALPVVDSETVTVTYADMFRLLADLRGMGEGNALAERSRTFPGKNFFFEAARRYAEKFSEEDGRIRASFEIIFLIGWAPHESQQKPLRPGSAQTRLAKALGTEEKKL